MKNYNEKEIIWKGNLNDDCTASWKNLILRAEWMDQDFWWWAVYDSSDNNKEIDSSNNYSEYCKSGSLARSEAEIIAKNHINNRSNKI